MIVRPHQKAALDAVIRAITSGQRIISVAMATGSGKTAIVVELIDYLYKRSKGRILALVSKKDSLDNIQFLLQREGVSCNVDDKQDAPVLLATYSQFQETLPTNNNIADFQYILCFEADDTSKINQKATGTSVLIGFLTLGKSTKGWFQNVEPVFRYSVEEAVADGYLAELSSPHLYEPALEGLCYRIFFNMGFEASENEYTKWGSYPDLIVSSQKEWILVETKAYQQLEIQQSAIDRAVFQMHKFMNVFQESMATPKVVKCCIILLGKVTEKQKEFAYNDYNIIIWDISNILFYIQGNHALLNDLLRLTPFPISAFSPIPSVGWNDALSKSTVNESYGGISADELEHRINECKAGKQQAVVYEDVCNDVLNYLFNDEFRLTSKQHYTDDKLFRMDLLCTLKGTSAFWDFLITHYNSRFVVFEYKNHGKQLSQNFIYTTEKYLHNAALRNVAIIISRKGFSPNAEIVSKGCLKEHGKLIIGLTDQDLIKMLHEKDSGGEPSDYLLGIVERFLMSVSK
jgi:hypothetical protein